MRRRLLAVLAAAVPLAAAAYLPAGALADTASVRPASAVATATAPFTCSAVSVAAPAGTRVEAVTAVRHPAGTVDVPGTASGDVQVTDVPAFCAVTVTLTHPGAGDHAQVRVWLPEAGWNGRFQALGGSAYAAGDTGTGDTGVGLATAVKTGYAAATTDAGVGGALDTGWALDSRGRVNTALLENFADRSQHEMALVGKQVIDEVYGKAATYSYWNGCSTGGRQGYMEAQRHPDDFDGILADAPAVNWNDFEVATLWPQVVMNEEKTYPTFCEFNAFNQAAVQACDTLDGAKDGLIGDPDRCHYDPRSLIGTKVECDGRELTVSAADARVVRKIWDGPRTTSGRQLWYGLPVGADFQYLAATKTEENGQIKGAPFAVPAAWVSTFVKKQPAFDTSTLTYSQFDQVFQQAKAEYDRVIGTNDPDLSAFRDSGGKLLTWHGSADQLIPTRGTVNYRERVEHAMGGTQRVDDFYRLFLAPGAGHCALNGQVDDLSALTAWVEHGKAPTTLTATLTTSTGAQVTRDLCRYPLVSHYTGHGDPAAADSFACVRPARH